MFYVGQDCLSNRFTDLTKGQFQTLRKAAQLNQERLSRQERITELVELHPLLADLTYPQTDGWASMFLSSVGRQLRHAGRLSDRQIEAAEDAVLREIEQRAEDAERVVEPAPLPIPSFAGRVTVEGVVLTTKWQDSDYGGSLKMLIQHADGWKLWGTVPKSIDPANGNRLSFVASVEVSRDDDTFGFFSRPSQARIV